MSSFGATTQTQWDWRAAGNFMLGGAGGGLALTAPAVFWPEAPPPLFSVAVLALAALGLLLVWLEIGRPRRFLHVFFHPQTSWMSREAIVAVLLFAAGAAALWTQTQAAAVVFALLGFGFLFCQAFLLHAAKGIPAWREPMLIPLVLATGLVEGLAILICLLVFSGHAPIHPNRLLAVLLFLRLASWLIYQRRMESGDAPAAATEIIRDIGHAQIILGHFFPLLLLTMAESLPELARPLALLAGIVVTSCGWRMKYIIVVRAAKVQGYALGKPQRGRPDSRPPVRRGKGKNQIIFKRDDRNADSELH